MWKLLLFTIPEGENISKIRILIVGMTNPLFTQQ